MLIRIAFCPLCELPDDPSALIDSLPFGEAERLRLAAIRHVAAKRQSLAALLALSRLCGDGELPILREGGGKPRFAFDGAPHFNLSHTASVAVAALCEDAAVGVDLELPRAFDAEARIAERFFTASERAEISRHGDFLALWTRKEARAKCLGVPLSSVLSSDLSLPVRTYRAGDLTLSLSAEREFTVEFLNDIFYFQEVTL